ncbi:MAG: hypothetical protein GY737_13670 [Desulfobacteraceae bacterium]|nr:hypothetical protein [Desulfobacteraceae bacterium]
MRAQIKKFQNVEKKLSDTKGKFDLFALFLREDSPNKWDLLISADWARADKKASINIVAEEIRKELSDQELLMLSRLIILDKDDATQKAIQEARQVEHGLAEISDSDFLGLAIKHAYLITSRKESS